MKPNFEVDLHCHTTRSDGKLSPLELIQHASTLGMKVIAITDHDVLPPREILVEGQPRSILEIASVYNLRLMRGIEISCDTDIEDVHILAFGCDFEDPRFKALEKQVIQSKIDAYKKLVETLNDTGFPMKWEDVLTQNGVVIDETSIQKKMIFETMARLGYVETWKDAKNLTQTKPEFNVLRVKPEPNRIIELIRNTGGISILAHPFLINPINESTLDYVDRLIQFGLNGIEVSYAYSKTNYRGEYSDQQIEAFLRARYQNQQMIFSGGSDFHGGTDGREIGMCGISYLDFVNAGILRYYR